MRVAPVSPAYMVNRYVPRKVRDQSERIQQAGRISEPGKISNMLAIKSLLDFVDSVFLETDSF